MLHQEIKQLRRLSTAQATQCVRMMICTLFQKHAQGYISALVRVQNQLSILLPGNKHIFLAIYTAGWNSIGYNTRQIVQGMLPIGQ